ncbi:transcription antitermination factor NusB [Candidatus Woesearchaeota archaeon]|nr:transcription antitermination factor NusB [Candidatus Woesearchaeota archaeon]MDP6738817.1 transcription antitermination factor NusB [Planctomycetota bacterium]MDP6937907.1 transcription antitermination factor NusB [Planctomycetota bacterium]
MKSRTRARQLALQFLYQVDLLGPEKVEDLTGFLQGEEKPGDARTYARHLVEGTLGARESLDKTIQSVAQNWEISRMAVIDRNVLRLATFELMMSDEIPPNVAINEAIELGKRFSTAQSGSFINGILDKIKNQAAQPEESPDPEPEAECAAGSEEPETP